ncbi:MAG: hypothetical protein LBI58_05565 [Tannerellaceae bacterium]|jgi:hypothetical protein|nr:hypothetical protein [Tannerellaceae bacterium]
MKKVNIITGLLLIYLIVMSVIGWPGNKPEADYVQYFVIMGVSLSAIILLRVLQRRRTRWREKQKNGGNTDSRDR